MTHADSTKANAIRNLNDFFRRHFVGGTVVLTSGINAMPEEQRRCILQKVRDFQAFTEDNDPHDEHDFGEIDESGVRCFWKIDYYDREMKTGSPAPADDVVTTRVLTIMLADEY
jgi:hypothetical protein